MRNPLLRFLARCCNNPPDEEIKNDLEILDKSVNSIITYSVDNTKPAKKETLDESTMDISPVIKVSFPEPPKRSETLEKKPKKPRKVKHRNKKETQSSLISEEILTQQVVNTSQPSTTPIDPIERRTTIPKPLKGILKRR